MEVLLSLVHRSDLSFPPAALSLPAVSSSTKDSSSMPSSPTLKQLCSNHSPRLLYSACNVRSNDGDPFLFIPSKTSTMSPSIDFGLLGFMCSSITSSQKESMFRKFLSSFAAIPESLSIHRNAGR